MEGRERKREGREGKGRKGEEREGEGKEGELGEDPLDLLPRKNFLATPVTGEGDGYMNPLLQNSETGRKCSKECCEIALECKIDALKAF